MKNIKEQLQAIGFKPSQDKPSNQPIPSPDLWEGDGLDHINILKRGETVLGRLLSHNTKTPFKHHIFGKFDSMETFWFYIQSEQKDDRIRIMSGEALVKFRKKLKLHKVDNFKAIIMDSNWQRIQQHRNIVKHLKESTLPFDCYHSNDEHGVRIRPIYFKWVIQGFEEIRNAVKENRDPDFNFLLDKPNSGIYDFVTNKQK